MTTLKDLSKHLGLSVTQVSRALNGYSDVSEATRERVEEAAKALNYTPNIAARRLVSGRSGVVGFVERSFPGIARDIPLFETVTGLSTQFSNRDMQFVLHLTPEDVQPDGAAVVTVYDRLMRGGSLDGFVVTGPCVNDARIPFLQRNKVPFVVHGRTEASPDYPYFDIDNAGLVHQLTSHLIGLGHRRIALISGMQMHSFVQHRLQGFTEAMTGAGLEVLPHLLRNGPMSESLGLIATAQMFADAARAPTGIICGNTLIAKGVYAALEALSLRVPQDVSVVAHDDVMLPVRTEALTPALTVTRSSLSESWGPLAEFLVRAIDGKPLSEMQKVAPVAFIEGASTGPAPG